MTSWFDRAEEHNEASMLYDGYPESLDAWEEGLDPDRLEEIEMYGYENVDEPLEDFIEGLS